MYLLLLVVIGYASIGAIFSIWLLPVFLVFYATRGVGNVLFISKLHHEVSSKHRATVLSVKSMMGRLIFAPIGPFIGRVMDFRSLQTALLVSACLFGLLGLRGWWMMRNAGWAK